MDFLQNYIFPSSPVSFAELALLTPSTSHEKCVIHFTDTILMTDPLNESHFFFDLIHMTHLTH